jgi:adenylate kinase
MRLVFFGPPGSGKGTQAIRLSEKMGLPHISLGDMLRQEISGQTEIGKQIKSFMDAGKLVPDSITIELTKQRIQKQDCNKGFIVDGFPRSLAQADAFDQMLKDLKIDLDHVVYFQIPVDLVVERLCGRVSCPKCGAVFHLKYNPPKRSEICDRCSAQLVQRSDDNETSIRTRFEVYENQTKPLLERYKNSGLLATLDASQLIDNVFKDLLKLVGYGGN